MRLISIRMHDDWFNTPFLRIIFSEEFACLDIDYARFTFSGFCRIDIMLSCAPFAAPELQRKHHERPEITQSAARCNHPARMYLPGLIFLLPQRINTAFQVLFPSRNPRNRPSPGGDLCRYHYGQEVLGQACCQS